MTYYELEGEEGFCWLSPILVANGTTTALNAKELFKLRKALLKETGIYWAAIRQDIGPQWSGCMSIITTPLVVFLN